MKRNMSLSLTMVVALSLQLLSHTVAKADDFGERELQKLLRPFYYAEAARYKFSLDKARKTGLTLVDKPVMSWTGRESGLSSGDVFVWTHDGRAEVIGCIGSLPRSNDNRMVFHEFHALTEAPLPGVRVGKYLWKPVRSGVDSRRIKDAPLPAKLASQRLVQMRALTREFEVRMQTPSGTKERLRRLPQPIFRNQSKKGDLSDGALFAFVWTVGTDPEFLLLVESLPTDDGHRWHYSPVRFNHRELWLEHREQEVWTASRLAGRKGEPYISIVTGYKTVQELQNEAKRRAADGSDQ